MIDIYKANSYDEAIEFNGEIKNPYKKFLNFFNDHNYKDLYQKKKFAHNFLKKLASHLTLIHLMKMID